VHRFRRLVTSAAVTGLLTLGGLAAATAVASAGTIGSRLARDGAGELSAGDECGPAQWTLDTLAQAARDAGIQVQRSQVRRILLAEKVRWRRTRSWAASTDPEFAPKGPRSWSSTPARRRAPRSSAPANSGR
jgi:hypothetical protein